MSEQVSQLFEIKGLVAAAFTPFNNDGYVLVFVFSCENFLAVDMYTVCYPIIIVILPFQGS